VCDLDNEKLVVRDDDSEPVIRKRLEAYERQTQPVLEYYRSAGRRVVHVDADNDPPTVVFEKIREGLETADGMTMAVPQPVSRKIRQAMEQDDRSKDGR
jgi:hypothetical protein